MNRNFLSRRVAGLLAATVSLAVIGCSSTRYERSTGEFVDDQVLNRRVHYALNTQPVYKFPDVHVHSYRGVVQLSGFVASDQQKEAAVEIARRVRGVAQVENAISLAPLADTTVHDYIPGRENGDAGRTSTGAATGSSGVTYGRATNEVRTTNTIVR